MWNLFVWKEFSNDSQTDLLEELYGHHEVLQCVEIHDSLSNMEEIVQKNKAYLINLYIYT